jgi:cysteine synthase
MVARSMVAFDANRSTPLVRLTRFSSTRPVYAKLEHLLLTGGIFDRVASAQVAKLRPELENKGTAIIAGSGSTCLAFAAALARVKTKVIAVCPTTMLPEHRLLLRMHRLQLVQSDGGLEETAARANDEATRSGGVLVYSPSFERDVGAFFEATVGRDLAQQLAAIDGGTPREISLVVPLGSRALIAGLSRGLATAGIHAHVVATVAPAGVNSRQDDLHAADRATTPQELELAVVDDQAALAARSEAARAEGLLVGLSSAGALRVARERSAGSLSVAIMVDAGDRYFSVDREAALREVAHESGR